MSGCIREHLHAAAVLIIILVSCGSLPALELPTAQPEDVGISSKRLERLTAKMKSYIDDNRLAGVVTLVARRGKVVHFEAHGWRFKEENRPMRTDTIFRIASMTKPITSVALMTLYEEGAFQLDDAISKWMPEYADPQVKVVGDDGERLEPANGPITIRQVLTHTAGLVSSRSPRRPEIRAAQMEGGFPATMAEALARSATVPLQYHPGEAWEYSNATDIVGVLVEKMSGMTLDDFCRERIFEPLGMPDTHFVVPEGKLDRMSALYRPNDDLEIELWEPPKAGALRNLPETFFMGAGGLMSTAADYWRFQQMMLNGGELDGVRLLGRRTVELIVSNHIPAAQPEFEVWPAGPGYGFGLGYAILLDPGQAIEPNSPGTFNWGGAFGTWFFVDPLEELIGIVMVQLVNHRHVDHRLNIGQLAQQAIIDPHPPEPPRIRGFQGGLRR
jgi:CubicO group peptidase (beta-lactamase class C family)